jgi:TetR/AcrR family transcriptional regulator
MAARLSRRERERQRHRQEILAAAHNLFSRKGFEKTTMAEIAEQAEFAVGTLYKLFKDKKALYRSLVLETMGELERGWTAALEGPGSEIERIGRYIDSKAAFFAKHASTARIYFSQIAGVLFQPVADLDCEVQAIYERVLSTLESVFRSGVRKKLFVQADPKMLAVGLEGWSNAFLARLVERPDSSVAREIAEHAKQLFFGRICLEPCSA